ncbi:hypothetical protein, unlikely [Trypanosoma congolense IL3000]|jgi:hypothetical protein|uniref:Uncharacterized protein n=1 Tax=Trypanosoma congolense (strain IL3000) TaxID=1068625 RepID=F9W6K0_TRYCI|nr:hypothetical protein, unlikely [Trypanosoma congolense IL3000]
MILEKIQKRMCFQGLSYEEFNSSAPVSMVTTLETRIYSIPLTIWWSQKQPPLMGSMWSLSQSFMFTIVPSISKLCYSESDIPLERSIQEKKQNKTEPHSL